MTLALLPFIISFDDLKQFLILQFSSQKSLTDTKYFKEYTKSPTLDKTQSVYKINSNAGSFVQQFNMITANTGKKKNKEPIAVKIKNIAEKIKSLPTKIKNKERGER